MAERNAKQALDEEVLNAVTGGANLYEGADGMDRDSWFVSLVTRIIPDAGRRAAVLRQNSGVQGNGAPLSTFIVGEYSKRP